MWFWGWKPSAAGYIPSPMKHSNRAPKVPNPASSIIRTAFREILSNFPLPGSGPLGLVSSSRKWVWLASYLFLQLVLPAPQVLEGEGVEGGPGLFYCGSLWVQQASEAESGSFHGLFTDSHPWGFPQNLSYRGMGMASLISEDGPGVPFNLCVLVLPHPPLCVLLGSL